MADACLSLVEGIPLEEEAGQGAHTIAGYLREVVARHGPAEALVMREGDIRLAWSYDGLLERSVAVARALVACGIGKGERVGILMTNRAEFVFSLFGIALAGGVPVALSTFSTRSELDYLLSASQISLLLFEQHVLKTDFHGIITALEPAIEAGSPGALASQRYPYLRHLVSLGGVQEDGEPAASVAGGAVESWRAFLARGAPITVSQAVSYTH
ncbi:MAG: AMP-binding protein, partial [Novosphingobium sp.]|nr:AMP-binding protein [Novosphingobium sp.]